MLYSSFSLILTSAEDAAAAALFTACKIEDTLKKSRDILCAAYNLRANASEHVTADDAVSYCFYTSTFCGYISK